MVYRNRGGENPVQANAYLDDVRVSEAVPPGLGADGDGDGLSDAWEIGTHGSVAYKPPGMSLTVR